MKINTPTKQVLKRAILSFFQQYTYALISSYDWYSEPLVPGFTGIHQDYEFTLEQKAIRLTS